MRHTQTPISIEGIRDKLYAGFWARLGSLLLDGLFMIPFGILIHYLNSQSLNMYYFTFMISIIFSLWYQVYLVKVYGGTPGKLLAGIKIIRIDGNEIGWEEAIMRHIVLLLISIFSIIVEFSALSQADEYFYQSLNWYQKQSYLVSLAPDLFMIQVWITNIWVYSELIVLLTNKRKRAIHDYMANTVIIKQKYENDIREFMLDTASENASN